MLNWWFFRKPLITLMLIPLMGSQNCHVQAINDKLSYVSLGYNSQNLCGSTLFSDDFNDGNADGWTTRLDGTWYVDNFRYVVDMGSGYELRGESLAGDTTWTDYTYEADVVIEDGYGKDFLYRYIDENNFYSTSIIETYDFINIVKVENGIASTLKMIEFPQDEYEWYHVVIKVEGNQISVYVNGDPAISYDDTGSSLIHGKIGFQGYTAQVGVLKARFDNVLVRDLCSDYYAYMPLINK